MSTRQPITVAELEELIARQLLACTDNQRAAFASVRVPFYSLPLHRLGTTEEVLVVAQLADAVIYFEDVEEGFELAKIDPDGVLPPPTNMQYEIRHILHQAGL